MKITVWRKNVEWQISDKWACLQTLDQFEKKEKEKITTANQIQCSKWKTTKKRSFFCKAVVYVFSKVSRFLCFCFLCNALALVLVWRLIQNVVCTVGLCGELIEKYSIAAHPHLECIDDRMWAVNELIQREC